MSRTSPNWTIPLGRPPLFPFMGYWLTRAFLLVSAQLFHRLRVSGRRSIPEKGGALLVVNHQSNLDVPYLCLTTRRVVHFIARRSLMDSWVTRFLLRCSRSILADRDGADREAFTQAVALLRMGEILCVFPEGTRSPDGRMRPFKRGAELIARRAGVPLVPVAVAGTFEAWPRHARRPRTGRVRIQVGRAIAPEEIADPQFDLFREVNELYAQTRSRLGLPDPSRALPPACRE